MQIAWQLDDVTKRKIKKSFLIATAGFVAGFIAFFLSDRHVVEFLASHPLVALAVGSYAPFLLNSLNEWKKGIMN